MGTDRVTVAVIEDHPAVQMGLRLILEQTGLIEISHAGESVDEFVTLKPRADVVLLDLVLPGTSGPDAVSALTVAGYRVLVFSAHAMRDDVVPALQAGASGFLPKAAAQEELIDAIREVARGNTHISPQLASFLLQDRPLLSERELQVLKLVAEGDTDQDIADQLGLSVSTVRSYLDRIRQKTGARRRSQLTRVVLRGEVLGPESNEPTTE